MEAQVLLEHADIEAAIREYVDRLGYATKEVKIHVSHGENQITACVLIDPRAQVRVDPYPNLTRREFN